MSKKESSTSYSSADFVSDSAELSDQHALRLIQPFVSKPDSIRMRLCKRIWGEGIHAFFSENIPFSLRNGRVYAERLALAFSRVAAQPEFASKPSLTVVEYGAGMGLLSHQFLSVLKSDYPKLYVKTTVYCTDFSSAIIFDVTKIPHEFTDPEHHLKMKVLDPRLKKGDPIPEIAFAFSTYLLDSLDAIPLEYRDGVLYELKVSTSISPVVKVLDASHADAPRLMNGAFLTDALFDTLPISICSRWVDHLVETYEPVLLSEHPVFGKYVPFLTGFLKHYGAPSLARFNFSLPILDHLLFIEKSLAKGGLYVVSDFGFSSQMEVLAPEFLNTHYGLASFYSVCFPLIRYACSKKGLSTRITQNPYDETQDLLVSRGMSDDVLDGIMTDIFKPELGRELVLFLDSIDPMITSESFDLEALKLRYHSLSDDQKTDYYVLKSVGTLLISLGAYSDAAGFVQRLVETYPEHSVDGWVLMGVCLQQMGFVNESISMFDKALYLCPEDPFGLGYQAVGYSLLHDYDRALSLFRRCVSACRRADVWFFAGVMLTCYQQCGETELLGQWCQVIREMAQSDPAFVPDDVLKSVDMHVSASRLPLE